jgi:hypothetical protein
LNASVFWTQFRYCWMRTRMLAFNE